MAEVVSFKTHKHIPRILGLGLFLQQLDAMILNTAIPQMSLALDTTPLRLKLAITSYLLTLAMMVPVSGYLADRFGTRRCFFHAMIIFLIGSVVCGFAHDLLFLIAGRLIQGFGAALLTPVARLVLLRTFSRSDYLVAFTAYTLIGQMGLMLGPVLGGVLTSLVSWRSIFFVNVPMVLIGLYWVHHHIPNYTETKLPRFDWFGFWLFGGAAGLITFAFSWLTEDQFNQFHTPLLLLGIGALLIVLYIWHARRTQHPSLDISVFRIRTFRAVVINSTLFRLGVAGTSFLLPLQFQIQFGYSPLISGLLIFPNALAFWASKPCFKIILHRFGFKRCLITTACLTALVLLALSWLSVGTPLWCLLVLMAALGFTSSLQYSFINTLNFADIPPGDSSRATSVGTVFMQLGLSFSVCFCAGLLVGSSHLAQTPLLSPLAFHYTYWVLSAVTLLSAVLFCQLQANDGANLLKGAS